ncbi:MAG: hypothetical protein M1838_001879 [Thelocarpon superellum]|nr:MAG: hypothetical protein M1838_001879 [Thelocarpon superellum]
MAHRDVSGGPSHGLRTAELEQLVKALRGRIYVEKNQADGFLSVEDLSEIGVARISVGPELYKAAMLSYQKAAAELLEGQ